MSDTQETSSGFFLPVVSVNETHCTAVLLVFSAVCSASGRELDSTAPLGRPPPTARDSRECKPRVTTGDCPNARLWCVHVPADVALRTPQNGVHVGASSVGKEQVGGSSLHSPLQCSRRH